MIDKNTAQSEPVLVVIDISKARHEVLIAVPGKKRWRRLFAQRNHCPAEYVYIHERGSENRSIALRKDNTNDQLLTSIPGIG